MPKKLIKIDIKVNDHGLEDKTRVISLELRGDNALFRTSDFCADEGVITPLNSLLRESARESVLAYIKSGTQVLHAAKERQGDKKPTRKTPATEAAKAPAISRPVS